VRATATVLLGLLLIVVFGGGAARLYTDALWFGELGLADVYRARIIAVVTVRMVIGATVAALALANHCCDAAINRARAGVIPEIASSAAPGGGVALVLARWLAGAPGSARGATPSVFKGTASRGGPGSARA
jgi:uncharacterized membrane protein (UPF0182 family)